MAGKIVADQLEHSTAGSIATNFVVEGSAKAWVDFTTITSTSARDSFNVASLTDSGTGQTVINYTSSMGSANFAATMYTGAGDSSTAATTFNNNFAGGLGSKTSSSVTHVAFDSVYTDAYKNDVVVHGDLA